ncbi:hypothetical protein EXU57_03985 [Segetibacter sp. 3557_3]|uniref:hypothetical protein n=1 Tax=Segetibacter sp. 3557_3 TaxID=2547429 RepID=UPI00105868A7|nr:hypothetical protein [Segetibacter sp. 3557_3]TDH29236.1 hypothetical protein EXU57_03985 [Segetibacter sp. 3557_3]
MKILLSIIGVFLAGSGWSQKIDSIYFNLYTDSLKKGVHNYINVDGKLSTGSFLPLMSDEVSFSSSAGKWDGNSIIIDSSYKFDSVVISVALKSNPQVTKSVTIYIKRKETVEALRTEQEILDDLKRGKKKNLAT